MKYKLEVDWFDVSCAILLLILGTFCLYLKIIDFTSLRFQTAINLLKGIWFLPFVVVMTSMIMCFPFKLYKVKS